VAAISSQAYKTKTDLLQLGDVVSEPFYGQLRGASQPVLLLAAGQSIDSEAQLRRLREAGYAVRLSSEMPSASAASPASHTPPDAPVGSSLSARAVETPLEAEFGHRVEIASRVREVVTDAVRDLARRVFKREELDLQAMLDASSALVSEVSADAHAITALTFLRRCDDYTVEHSADVAILMVAMARWLEVPEPELRILALAGLMHDVGKQQISPAILNKPTALTREEFMEIWKHPQYGYKLLSACPGCPEAVQLVALQHHERLDGSGYPGGLAGDELHPVSRIAAVADTFDAMTANRVYRKGLPSRQALLEIYGASGIRLDAPAVSALVKLVGVYPVGTRIVLNTGERGVVTAPNPENTTLPVVLLDHDRHGQRLPSPVTLALQDSGRHIVSTLP
jgi:HD-GYP domain-containing protein (c-di-GMP phosphodiesterase class II)